MDEGRPTLELSRIKWGIRIFIPFTVFGMVVVLYRSSLADCLVYLSGFKLTYLALATSLVVFEWLVAGAQTYMFASQVHPGITYGGCVRASLANTFMGGLTPSQTGGGPAQIFVLHKEGMSLMGATVSSFLGGFLSTCICLSLAGILFSILIAPQFATGLFPVVITMSVFIFSLVIILALLSLMNPCKFGPAIHFLLRVSPRAERWLERKGILVRVFDLATTYHDITLNFFIRARVILLFGVLLSAVFYFNRFFMAYVVLKGLGIDADFWQVIYRQFLLMLIFYFAPSPGAAGFAEITTVELMRQIIPAGYQGAFVLLWRFLTLFFSMIVGAAVTLPYLYKAGKWRHATQERLDNGS